MVNNYDVAVLSEKVAYLETAIKNAGIELPEVTSEDNGKTLQVVDGAWDTGAIIPDPVSANPEGSASGNITSLGIGNSKYTLNPDTRYLRGMYCALALNSGKIDITISFEGDYNNVAISKDTGISGVIYGNTSAGATTLEVDSVIVAGHAIRARFTPSVTLSDYTSLSKPFMLVLEEDLVLTLSKTS